MTSPWGRKRSGLGVRCHVLRPRSLVHASPSRYPSSPPDLLPPAHIMPTFDQLYQPAPDVDAAIRALLERLHRSLTQTPICLRTGHRVQFRIHPGAVVGESKPIVTRPAGRCGELPSASQEEEGDGQADSALGQGSPGRPEICRGSSWIRPSRWKRRVWRGEAIGGPGRTGQGGGIEVEGPCLAGSPSQEALNGHRPAECCPLTPESSLAL
jgi:hypothetical protein